MIKESVNWMRIYVDACPVISIVEQVEKRMNLMNTFLFEVRMILEGEDCIYYIKKSYIKRMISL